MRWVNAQLRSFLAPQASSLSHRPLPSLERPLAAPEEAPLLKSAEATGEANEQQTQSGEARFFFFSSFKRQLRGLLSYPSLHNTRCPVPAATFFPIYQAFSLSGFSSGR